MLTRFRLGEFDEGPRRPHARVDEGLLDSAEHRALAREAAAASAVLASNRCEQAAGPCALPVDAQAFAASAAASDGGGRVAVIGPFAHCNETVGSGWAKTNCYLHSYAGITSEIVSILDAVREDAAKTLGGVPVDYVMGTTDVQNVSSSSIDEAAAAAGGATLTVLAVGTGSNVEKEGLDRTSLELPAAQAQLLLAVSAACKTAKAAGRTATLIVVVVSAGPVVIDPSLADAVLYAHYGGEEAGHGIADLIFGRVSPSARFPLTVYERDYLSKVGPVSDFFMTSGVGRTYRYLDVHRSPPLYYFG
jgi:beta-glucosidase